MATVERIGAGPPHNLDAEQSVLGADPALRRA